MSADTAAVVLARVRVDAINQGITRIHFKFAGGEPTLALESIKQFCQLSAATLPSHQFRVSFGVITNGVHLSPEALALFTEHSMNVSISLDGFEESHDKTRYLSHDRTRVGTWQIIQSNIDTLLASGITPYVLHTVTPSSIDALSELQQCLSQKGIGFRLSLMRLPRNPTESLQDRFINALVKFYSELPHVLPLNMNIERDACFAEWNPSRAKQLSCGSGRNYLSVDSTGMLASCQMAASRPLADLREDTIETARARASARDDTRVLTAPTSRSGGCTSCFFRATCAGGCPQHTLSVSSTMSHPSPWCRVYGELYPVYIRAIAQHRLRVIRARFSAQTHEQTERIL